MKQLIIGLVVLVAALSGLLVLLSQDSSATLYDDAPHITYSQLLDDTKGKNLYYFYREDCLHCNNIKPNVAKFYYNKPDDIDFVMLDGGDKNNVDMYFKGAEEDFVEYSGTPAAYTDITIWGTPTLIEIDDGQVTQFLTGENEVPEYLETL